MSIELTWLGHGGWSINTGQHHILLDPFLSESPVAPCQPDDLQADFLLVSHGHFDHIADVPAIAQRTQAQGDRMAPTASGCAGSLQYLATDRAGRERLGRGSEAAHSRPAGSCRARRND